MESTSRYRIETGQDTSAARYRASGHSYVGLVERAFFVIFSSFLLAHVPAFADRLPPLPQSALESAIAAPLIRFDRDIVGGAHTNGAWFGGASVALAVAAYSGNESADSRLLEQMRYTIVGGNDISANGGYPSQHERHVTAMYAIAKNTPRIWNALTDLERGKIDLLMKAAFVASAFTTSDSNPYVQSNSQQYALDGDSNLNRGWNPNYREGMIGGVLVGVVYFGGPAEAEVVLNTYDHEAFINELAENGLTNILETFTWKANNPSSFAPTGSEIEAAIEGYRYRGFSLSDYLEIYRELLNHTYGAKVSCGLNDGAGIDGAGRIVSGCDSLPNAGSDGMLLEFDSSDANGPRSSATYAYYGYRPHMNNLLTLIVGGYWQPDNQLAERARALLSVGNTDFWYKVDHGYVGYAKGRSQGVFDQTDGTTWGFTYNRALWEQVLRPYLTGSFVAPSPPYDLTVE